MDPINNNNMQPTQNNNTDNTVSNKTVNYKGKKTKATDSTENKLTTLAKRAKNFISKKISSRKAKKVSVDALNSNKTAGSATAQKNLAKIKNFKVAIQSYQQALKKNAVEQNKDAQKDVKQNSNTTEVKLLDEIIGDLEKLEEDANLSKNQENAKLVATADRDIEISIHKAFIDISNKLDMDKHSTEELESLENEFSKETKNTQEEIQVLYKNTKYGNSGEQLSAKIELKNSYESKKNLYNEIIKFRKEIPGEIKKLNNKIDFLAHKHDSVSKKKLNKTVNHQINLLEQIKYDT